MPSVSTTINVIDGPDRGRRSLFLGMGLSRDEARFELAESSERLLELCYLHMSLAEHLHDHGFHAAYDLAERFARSYTLRVYEREAHTPWYRAPRFHYAGRFALQVEDGPRGLQLAAGAKVCDELPAAVAGRLTSRFDDALAGVEQTATRFSAVLAALEPGAVRDAAQASARAVAASVTDARRLAVVGTQLEGARAERVLSEIEALAHTVDAALTEAVELHLQLRERVPQGFDALPAHQQVRAITQGVRELS